MSKPIVFVTGNERKVWQAKSVLEEMSIALEQKDVEMHEVQSHNPELIAIEKAKTAYVAVKQSLVVCDHSWSFTALKGFPGGYMKDINSWFEAEDFLALLSNKTDRSVTMTELVVFTNGSTTKTFSMKFPGKVANSPRGVGKVPCERVVIFDGESRTIAECIDAGDHARDMGKSAWKLFGDWYAGS